MHYDYYLKEFQKSADKVDKKMLDIQHLNIYVGTYEDAVILKLYKKEWTNDQTNPLHAKTRIFFSIWVSETTIKQNKLFYNIHAFNLRELNGYSIKSRDFAQIFRKDFQEHEKNWKNVSLKFGPLTLMEGWQYFTHEDLETIVVKLTNNFLGIEYLIENTLLQFENQKIV